LAQVDNLYFQYDICIIFQQVAKGSHKIHGHFVWIRGTNWVSRRFTIRYDGDEH